MERVIGLVKLQISQLPIVLIVYIFQREQLERARLEQKRAAEKMKPAETIVPENEKKEGEESAAEVKAKNATVMPQTVWLCLRCGSQACGSTSEGHCIQHYKTPRLKNRSVK